MKTVMLILSLLSLLAFSIGCNRSEDRSATGTSMQKEEARERKLREDVNKDIQNEKADVQEEKADVREEMEDVREEQKDVEKERLDLNQKIDDASEKVKDETRMED